MKKSTHRSQDKPQTKLRIATRRARLVKIFAKGATVTKAHKQLKAEGIEVSRATVGFDLQALAALAPANIQSARAEAHSELTALKKFVMGADDMKDTETVSSLLAIHDRIVTLLGLAAPTKSISAKVSVDPSKMGLYQRFLAETRHLSNTQLDAVFAFARELPGVEEPDDMEAIDAN